MQTIVAAGTGMALFPQSVASATSRLACGSCRTAA
jgi:hypothetical protein